MDYKVQGNDASELEMEGQPHPDRGNGFQQKRSVFWATLEGATLKFLPRLGQIDNILNSITKPQNEELLDVLPMYFEPVVCEEKRHNRGRQGNLPCLLLLPVLQD